ncbi:MAG: RNA polymerase subunit sigma-70 [Acidimicrobiales bacterium]
MVPSLLARAQGGDDDAFGELVAPYRAELHLHCYRMLGSLADADDVLQDTMIAAWRAIGAFSGRSSLRTWLYRIATNRCLNAIRDAKRRPPPVPMPPFSPPRPSAAFEGTWLQPYPDAWLEQPADPQARLEAGEAIRLAFVAALQRMAPRQGAALLLYDVLGFALPEVAAMLDATPTAVKGLLQRARAALEHDPHLSPRGPASPGSTANDDEVARRFAEAYSTDDVDALVALLTDDAWLAMPPAPHEYHGTDGIAGFLRASAAGRAGQHLGLVPTRANRQHGFVCFLGDAGDPRARPSGVMVLDIAAGRITGITRFLEPTLVKTFLPTWEPEQ